MYLNGGSWQIVDEFTEVESGKRPDRPALDKALAAARLARICGSLSPHGWHSICIIYLLFGKSAGESDTEQTTLPQIQLYSAQRNAVGTKCKTLRRWLPIFWKRLASSRPEPSNMQGIAISQVGRGRFTITGARTWALRKAPDRPSPSLGSSLVRPDFAGCQVPVGRGYRRARRRQSPTTPFGRV